LKVCHESLLAWFVCSWFKSFTAMPAIQALRNSDRKIPAIY
jgi:hypothetical protein